MKVQHILVIFLPLFELKWKALEFTVLQPNQSDQHTCTSNSYRSTGSVDFRTATARLGLGTRVKRSGEPWIMYIISALTFAHTLVSFQVGIGTRSLRSHE